MPRFDLSGASREVAVCVAACLTAAHGAAAQEIPPPSLFHEILIGAEMGVPGTSQLSGTCDLSGDSEFHFIATGAAFGPYAGTFTENGTFTIGPPMPQPEGNVVVLVTDFRAHFRIESGESVITGTKTIAQFTVNRGACGELAFFEGGPHAAQMRADVVYTARVKTKTKGEKVAQACYSGAGSVQYGDTQLRGIPDFQGYSFAEPFLTSTATDCADSGDSED